MMETKVLEIIKDESEKTDVRKYTCINGFGYSQFERNIADKVVKLFTIPRVMLSLPSQAEIDEQIDKYAFRVPYDGSNNFYDEVALKHYKAGIEWLLGRIQGNGA